MACNISGSGWVDMSTLKSGCQLLIPNPMLDMLEELWGYVTTNLKDHGITEDAMKKKEFLHYFAKWCNLQDILVKVLHMLIDKTWIELNNSTTNPEDFTCCPFFNVIHNKILGKDWAYIYDIKHNKYTMLPDLLGFSKLVTLMETYNCYLHDTMYHCLNEVLQALIMQKLPDRFQADLCDCKVSKQLPYTEWKAACKDMEEY
ncbi:hypothetical protein F5050DRAFT_1804913 [Lentinula boryana]|uniref:Uncharacterized protein n=1 Tax=Lentinula boryana TaxID=40481 RepID=A0ABQ8QLT4_9AGAR|nr:hypothetical protein F5050DRAFT_1804913 [Lentinula boryana]